MADFNATADALRAHLVAQFTALPIYWPNDDRDPSANSAAKDGWVLGEVRLLDEGPACLGNDGNRLHEDIGEFVVNIFVPVGTRVGTVETHATAIRAAFGVKSVAGVTITRRTIGPGERVDGVGKWYAVPVIIEFRSYRTE